MEEINNFQQDPVETIFQAYEPFRELLLRCPQHYLTNMQEVILFYKGLDIPTRQILDSKGAIPSMKSGDGPHYTKDCPLKDEGKTLEEAYYTQFGVSFPQGGHYKAAAPGFYQRNNRNPLYQEQRQSMEELQSKFMTESTKRHEENSNLIKEIRAATDSAIRNQGASIKALEIQIGKMSKVLQETVYRNLPSSTKTNLRDHVKSILTSVGTKTNLIRRIGADQYAVSTLQNMSLFFVPNQMTIPFPNCLYDDYCDEEKGSYGLKDFSAYSIGTTLLDDVLPPKEKDPGSFTLPCYINNLCFNKALADLGASVSVMPFSTYTNLGLGKLAPTKLIVELADRTVKHSKGIAENVLIGIDNFVFPVDFIVLDMPEDIKTLLILGRPFLSTAHAKIDVFKKKIALRVGNDKVVFKSDKPTSNIINRSLGWNLVDDLEPTIEEGKVIDEHMKDLVKTRHDNDIVDILQSLKTWMLTGMNEWVISLLEDRLVENFVSKQGGLME
ncbi:ribonuclease H-like domain, reverse transcriptase, RNA-dependent DNA polymerase [Tanacetum coccineum]